MGRMRRAKTKLISIAPGMIASAINANRQFSVNSTPTAMTSRISEMDGETMAICNRPVVVSTSPVRRDRMPPVFMSQSFDSGRCSSRSNKDRAQRQHDPHVQQPLAVILEHADRLREHDDADKQCPGRMEPHQPLRRFQLAIQQNAVNDEPHEQRLDHFQRRDRQRKAKHGGNRPAMRPKPVQILAQILPPLAATDAQRFEHRRGRLFFLGVGRRLLFLVVLVGFVEPMLLVVGDEFQIALPAGPRLLLCCSVRTRRIGSCFGGHSQASAFITASLLL